MSRKDTALPNNFLSIRQADTSCNVLSQSFDFQECGVSLIHMPGGWIDVQGM